MASTDNRALPTPVAVIAATSVVVLQVDHIVYNRLRGIYGGAADHVGRPERVAVGARPAGG